MRLFQLTCDMYTIHSILSFYILSLILDFVTILRLIFKYHNIHTNISLKSPYTNQANNATNETRTCASKQKRKKRKEKRKKSNRTSDELVLGRGTNRTQLGQGSGATKVVARVVTSDRKKHQRELWCFNSEVLWWLEI